jgi:hypothetical protein
VTHVRVRDRQALQVGRLLVVGLQKRISNLK